MPPAVKYVLPTNARDWSVAEESFERELRDRARTYKTNWDYYFGRHKRALDSDGSTVDDNIVINMLGLLVNKSVSGLFGTTAHGLIRGPNFDVQGPILEPGSASSVLTAEGLRINPSPEQLYLDQVFEANHKEIFLYDLGVTGCVCGHVFIKVLPGGLEAEDTGAVYPKLVVLDPSVVTVFWNAHDTSSVLWYRLEYALGQTAYRQDIIRENAFSGRLDRESAVWRIIDYQKIAERSTWQQVSDIAWSFPFPPLIEWKNLPNPGSYYGQSEIGVSGRVNDGLNFVSGNMQRILKYYANPRTVGTGVAAEQVQETSVSNFWTIPNPEAKVFNLEMKSDLSSSLNYIQFLYRAIFDVAQEIDPKTVQDKLGHLTNFGLRVLFRETLAKISLKRQLYGRGLRRLARTLLVMAGLRNVPVAIQWPDPLPSDPYEVSRSLEIDVRQFGLSRDTALEIRGHDPALEKVRRQAEADEFGPRATQEFTNT